MAGKKPTKEDLRDYLDWYNFVNEQEINSCVIDFFAEEMDILNPSYWECLLAWELADEYIKLRWIVFDENGDIVE